MYLRERTGVVRMHTAQMTCNATTARTKYLVRGSGPQSLVTCKDEALAGAAAKNARIISYFWMCFDDCLSPCPMWFLCIRPKELVAIVSCWGLLGEIKL